jgi:hypothetical protein
MQQLDSFTDPNLVAAVKRYKLHGPDRVVIDESGESTSPLRAKNNHGIGYSVTFIRKDGWMLAALTQFEMKAFWMWPEEWIAFIRVPDVEPQMMMHWHGANTAQVISE